MAVGPTRLVVRIRATVVTAARRWLLSAGKVPAQPAQAATAAAPGFTLRPAFVVASLADLDGPAAGMITLPHRLYWTRGGRVFDLDDRDDALDAYEAVLDAAGSAADVARWLNGELLASLWPEIYIARDKHAAWEQAFPEPPPAEAGRAGCGLMRESHRDVARIALTATTGRYEVALGGGNALHVHGVSQRPTEDVDLFVRREQQVRPAATVIADALEASGYGREPADDDDPDDLAGFWPELGEGLVDLMVSVPGSGELVQVQAAHFEFGDPVPSEVGPVLSLDDIAAWKTHAAVNRIAPRDIVDVAALLRHGYTIERLLRLVLEKDPGLVPEDFAEVGIRLDRMRDRRLAENLAGSGLDPAAIRALFQAWPREPRHAEGSW